MSKIDDLIVELCPDGVEHRMLGSITSNINIGINPRKFFKLNQDGANCFYVTVRELNGLQGVMQYEKTDLISEDAVKTINARAQIEKDDILFSNTGTVGKMALVIETPQNWGVNEGIYVIKPKQKVILSKFLYYYLSSSHAYKDYSAKLTGSTLKHVTQKALAEIVIPIPPLSVQHKIVKILDNFSKLMAELMAELAARNKQYEYYAQEIIKNAHCAKMISIKELGRWTGGGTPSMSRKEFWDMGAIPWVTSKDMKAATIEDSQNHITKLATEKSSAKLLPANTVAVVVRSGILKHTFPVAFIPFPSTINQDLKAVVAKKGVLPKYIFFVLYAYASDILAKTKKQGGTVDSLDVQKFYDFKVPVPPYQEQERIIAVLDRFNTLCNDSSTGLPAEIEARRKQYEYYRDKLLTFKEKKS